MIAPASSSHRTRTRTMSARLRAAAVALLALAALPAAAKPVYLTVPRAFGTGEAPVIDLAFQRHGPVQLRVVKPDPLDPFLAGQANLRRAYVTPQTRENPGRWLARGLNQARLPATFLYRALGEEYRLALAPGLPKRDQGGPEPRPVVRLAEGPEKLVDLPPGTELVRETWLNLDLGGAGRDYSVPGFDEYAFGSAWEERKVALEPLPAGVYLVQLVQGRVEGQVVLVVTDLRVQVKQTDGEVLVRVAGKDLLPVKGAEVQLRTAAGAAATGTTDAQGEVHLASAEPRLLVLVKAGEDRALVDTDFYSTLSASPDVFVYSDRPIYRPGDALRFRGIVRQPDAFLSRLFTPKAREVAISLDVAENRQVRGKARVDEFGCFSGELAIPADVASGVVRLTASLDGAPHGAEARVRRVREADLLPGGDRRGRGRPPGRAAQGQGAGPPLLRRRAARHPLPGLPLPDPARQPGLGGRRRSGGAGERGDLRQRLHQRGEALGPRAALLLAHGRGGLRRGPLGRVPGLRRQGRGGDRGAGPGAGRRRRAAPLALQPLGPRPRRPGHLRQRRPPLLPRPQRGDGHRPARRHRGPGRRRGPARRPRHHALRRPLRRHPGDGRLPAPQGRRLREEALRGLLHHRRRRRLAQRHAGARGRHPGGQGDPLRQAGPPLVRRGLHPGGGQEGRGVGPRAGAATRLAGRRAGPRRPG